MTSCFPIVGHMAPGVGSIDVDVVLQQVAKFQTYLPGDASLFDFVVVHSDSKLCIGEGAKSALYD